MFAPTLVLALTLAAAAPNGPAKPAFQGDLLARLVTTATRSEGPAAERAIEALRARGPESLEPLLAVLDEVSRRRGASEASLADSDLIAVEAHVRSVVDRVAGQRYGYLSRLYWYTDLEEAKAAAAASGKPILSLRMLGNLTDEYSCANSRFFRTTLYVNPEVGRQLRENFVLHWKSVRPVPRITIDFGDGRKIERTITGNSAHYVLAADGAPLDVLPGLYGPEKFQAWLHDMTRLDAATRSLGPTVRAQRLQAYHAQRSAMIVQQWARDFLAVESESPVAALQRELPVVAGRAVERSLANVRRPQLNAQSLAEMTNVERWEQIARLPEHRVTLDAVSRDVVSRENPPAQRAGARAMTKGKIEDPLLRLFANLQASIAADSVRNEYTLHRSVHEWFAKGLVPPDVEQLNDRVYAELFLTPNSDPWLGLATPGAYTALENAGVVVASP